MSPGRRVIRTARRRSDRRKSPLHRKEPVLGISSKKPEKLGKPHQAVRITESREFRQGNERRKKDSPGKGYYGKNQRRNEDHDRRYPPLEPGGEKTVTVSGGKLILKRGTGQNESTYYYYDAETGELARQVNVEHDQRTADRRKKKK